MDFYSQLTSSFVEYEKQFTTKSEEIKTRIEEKKKQLERLEKKFSLCYNSYIGWTENFLKPLAAELCKHFPGYQYDILGPFGLRSSCSIHFFRKPLKEIGHDEYFKQENIFSITIIPVSIKEGIFAYETGGTKDIFGKRTIADLNGLNNVTKTIENFSELVEFLTKVKTGRNHAGE